MEKVLKDWQDYVSVPREQLNGFSVCPFAKSEKIDYNIIKSENELLTQVLKKEQTKTPLFMMVDENDVLTSKVAEELVEFYNTLSTEYQYFVDDVNNHQYMNGISTGNCKYIIIVAQRKDVLENARNALRGTGYYGLLDNEYLTKIGVYL